ncbi:hypothetical protein MKX01_018145, partial [Papaver californicum]
YCSHYYTTAAYKATYAHTMQLLDNFEDWAEGESSTTTGKGRCRGGKVKGSKDVGGGGASFFRACFQQD